ncbi:MAG TPA: 16S rRNA (adenine(1518)-N(6)/adenine(1519)-N(6))-dimethyltransferase RsmA [Acidobacteriaceae bacterium]|nr:16S rRNA (adenine(1518)-N(6)/adenine(1519)-N(6))-dimethyltransferase RsmA [Acidobacteriaceae bacterium]
MGRHGTKLGQNFLVDEAATLRISEALGDTADRTVLEIGPGHGAITAHLARRCARLHCIEFDPALARELAFRFRNDPHVTVHHADILKTDLSSLAPSSKGEATGQPPLDVIGNLPYYITSDILLHLYAAARAGLLRRAILMTQREVAQRIAAPPGSSDYGALSALTQLHATVQELFTLPPAAFDPPPDVHSTVFRLDFAPRFAELDVPFEGFNRFLRATFAQKRKTLANNLRAAGYNAAQLTAAWPSGLAQQARAEEVPLQDLASLYRALESAPAAI